MCLLDAEYVILALHTTKEMEILQPHANNGC